MLRCLEQSLPPLKCMFRLAPQYSTVKRLRTLKLQLDVSETNPIFQELLLFKSCGIS